MNRWSSGLFALGFLALASTGCGSGDGTVEVGITADALEASSPTQAGPVNASARHLVLTVTEVNVHVAANASAGKSKAASSTDDGTDDTASSSDDESGKSGWKTVFSGEAKVDLLDATSIETLLGSVSVPAGKVTQVRLVLGGADLVDGSTTTAVTCPSCSESGLKIVTEGKVQVGVGGELHLTLNFDQAASLTQDASGYRLDPVIKIARAEEK